MVLVVVVLEQLHELEVAGADGLAVEMVGESLKMDMLPNIHTLAVVVLVEIRRPHLIMAVTQNMEGAEGDRFAIIALAVVALVFMGGMALETTQPQGFLQAAVRVVLMVGSLIMHQ